MAKTNSDTGLTPTNDSLNISDSVQRAFKSIVRYLPLAIWLLVILSAWFNGPLSKGIWVWMIVLLSATVLEGFVRVEGPSGNNQILILSLLGGTPILWTQSQSVDWLPLPMLITIICLVAVFSKSRRFVFTLTVALAVIELLLIQVDFPGYLFGGATFYDGIFAFIFLMANVLLYGAFAHFTKSEAVNLDKQIRDSYQRQSNATLEKFELALKEKSIRRIHESVLNTLRALSNPRIKLIPDEVLTVVETDLERIVNLQTSDSLLPIQKLILDSLATANIRGIEIEQNIEDDFEVDSKIVDLVKESLTEVFRNVERHSAASKLKISTRKIRNLTYLTVEDNGIGIQRNSKTTLGMQIINSETLKKDGHKILIESGPNSGTKITFIFDSTSSNRRDFSVEYIPLNSPRFRNLFLVLPSIVLIFLPIFVGQLENPIQASMAFIAYWFVLLILLNLKLSKYLNLFATVSFAIAMTSLAIFGSNIDGCQQAQGFQWVGSAFSTMVLALAVSPILNVLKVIFAFAYFTNALLIGVYNFTNCQDLAVVPGLIGALGALILSFGYYNILKLTTKNVQLQIKFQVEEETSLREREFGVLHVENLRKILNPVQAFFENINFEYLHKETHTFSDRAAIVEAQLRNSLRVLLQLSESMQPTFFEIIEFCISQDINLEIDILSESVKYFNWAPQDILEIRDVVFSENFEFLKFNFFEHENRCQLEIIGWDENKNKETEIKLKSLPLNHVFR